MTTYELEQFIAQTLYEPADLNTAIATILYEVEKEESEAKQHYSVILKALEPHKDVPKVAEIIEKIKEITQDESDHSAILNEAAASLLFLDPPNTDESKK